MRKFIELILRKLFKPEVPELVQIVHNREMSALGGFAKTVESIDSDKFSGQEFMMFVKIKYCLARGIEE